jgi:O-antigen ligase
MSEHQQTLNSSEWLEAAIAEDEPSRLSGIVFFLICAIPIFSAVAFGGNDAWALGLISIFTFLLAAFWVADSWLKKEFWFNSSVIQLPLLGLISIGAIHLLPLGSTNLPGELLSVPPSNSLSIAPYATRFAVSQLLIYFIFFAAALTFINNQKRLQKIVFVLIVFGSSMAFFGILQRLAGAEAIYGLRVSTNALPFASFINQHHFAAFMEMTTGITLALIFGQGTKKDKQILLIIAAVVMGIAILLTGSRGGMISLLGVIGFLVTANLLVKTKNGGNSNAEETRKKNFRRNFSFVAGGMALMLVLFGAVLLLGGDQSLLRGIGFEANQSDFSSGRKHFWQVGSKIFLDYPILGAGLDSFGSAFTNYDTGNGNLRVEQAHNDYLQVLAEAGILGFSCVVAFIFLLFKKSLQIIGTANDNFRRSTAIGALAGCFGVLVHSFFDFPLRTTSNAFFFLILVVIAANTIYYPKFQRRERRSNM